jgi:hypothetical protein
MCGWGEDGRLTAIIFSSTIEEEKIIEVTHMIAARLYRDDSEIDHRLRDFGVSREELVEVARAVAAARADAVADDPASAEGLFAYIYGTRALRGAFRAHGWHRHREDNVESVRHPERALKVIYQSVDIAADWMHSPRAISGKGSGADRLISAAQGTLFSAEELKAVTKASVDEVNTGAWFFCVSVEGDDVRAELSLPVGVARGNFDGFIERIFIIRPGEWSTLHVTRDDRDGGAAEFEPIISRK